MGPDRTLYFCEIGNHRVRRLDLNTHTISTAAGSGQKGYSGDGGPALQASLNEPYEVVFDAGGNMYFAEMQDPRSAAGRREDARHHHRSRYRQPRFWRRWRTRCQAQLRQPHSIAFDPQGRLMICDNGNLRIRRVNLQTGAIETSAGTGERKPTPDGSPIAGTPLNGPRVIALDPDGTLYLALREGNAIYRIDPRAGRIYHRCRNGRNGPHRRRRPG